MKSSNGYQQPAFQFPPSAKPFAPFRTLADFEYTETAVQGLLPRHLIDKQLAGICGLWCPSGSNLTIKNYADMKKSLDAAREYGVRVC
jgi:hypothetical protein